MNTTKLWISIFIFLFIVVLYLRRPVQMKDDIEFRTIDAVFWEANVVINPGYAKYFHLFQEEYNYDNVAMISRLAIKTAAIKLLHSDICKNTSELQRLAQEEFVNLSKTFNYPHMSNAILIITNIQHPRLTHSAGEPIE